MNAQIKKGILEMCILYIIKAEGPIYGYDLLKAMKLYFPEVNDSTFYAILRRLYKNNMTDIQYVGLQRKYYKINEEGRKMLEKNIGEWNCLVQTVKDIGI